MKFAKVMDDLTIRDQCKADISVVATAFAAQGWGSSAKFLEQYTRYLADQQAGTRPILIANATGIFSGYLTIVWQPTYPYVSGRIIPEIRDFNVLPVWRRQRLGSRLMDAAEKIVAARSDVIGINVGMHADYGPAQRMYVRRGYAPDGRGILYGEKSPAYNAELTNDDELTLGFTKFLVSDRHR